MAHWNNESCIDMIPIHHTSISPLILLPHDEPFQNPKSLEMRERERERELRIKYTRYRPVLLRNYWKRHTCIVAVFRKFQPDLILKLFGKWHIVQIYHGGWLKSHGFFSDLSWIYLLSFKFPMVKSMTFNSPLPASNLKEECDKAVSILSHLIKNRNELDGSLIPQKLLKQAKGYAQYIQF